MHRAWLPPGAIIRTIRKNSGTSSAQIRFYDVMCVITAAYAGAPCKSMTEATVPARKHRLEERQPTVAINCGGKMTTAAKLALAQSPKLSP